MAYTLPSLGLTNNHYIMITLSVIHSSFYTLTAFTNLSVPPNKAGAVLLLFNVA